MAKSAKMPEPAGPDAAGFAAPAALKLAGEALAAGAVPAEELRRILEQLGIELADASASVAEAEAFESENLLDADDEVLDDVAQKIVRARRQVTRLETMRALIAERLAKAEAEEAEEARRTRYRAAAAAVDEIRRWMQQRYASLATEIGDGLAKLIEVETLAEAANADRPEGVPRLEVEDFRALPAAPGTTIFREEIYYTDDRGEEFTPGDHLPLNQDASGQFWIGAEQRRRVYARTREVPETSEGRPRIQPRALPTAVHLPGVAYVDTDFWPRRSKAWGSS